MSRFLVAAWDGGGTVPPTLGLVAALIGHGHDVVVIADDTMEAEVVATGATYTPWRRAPQARASDTDRALIRDWEVRNPLRQARLVGDLLFYGPAALHAADFADAITQYGPDALVVDGVLTGAAAAAERSGLPTAAFAPNVNLLATSGVPPLGFGLRPMPGRVGRLRDNGLRRLSDTLFGTGALNDERRRLGLEPVGSLGDSFRRADTIVFLTSEAFDFTPDRPDPQVVYGGIPIPPADHDATWSPPWSSPRARPSVLVSLSTTYMSQDAVLARLVDALGGLDVDAVVTTGGGMRGRTPPSPPSNVVLAEHLPHAAVLHHVDLVVTHGGHGTVLRSLVAGVPVLVVPLARDQPDNAARVVYRGVGAQVSRRASVATLRREIGHLLGDDAVRRNTVELAARLQADLGAPKAVAALTGLVE